MSRISKRLFPAAAISSCLFLFHCAGPGATPDPDASAAPARLSLLLTDAPVEEATAVYVNVVEAAVRFVPAPADDTPPPADSPTPAIDDGTPAGDDDGEAPAGDDAAGEGDTDDDEGSWIVVAGEPVTYDLLTLQNGVTAVLGDYTPGAGIITEIRLVLDEDAPGSIVFDTIEYPLTVPSGSQSGLKIKGDVPLEDGYTTTVVVDFDAAKSIVETGNGEYKLKPVLSIESVTLEALPPPPAAE